MAINIFKISLKNKNDDKTKIDEKTKEEASNLNLTKKKSEKIITKEIAASGTVRFNEVIS